MMPKSRDFTEFVRRQQPAPAEEIPINWDRQREEWVEFLSQLYKKIEEFIAEYMKSGQIRLEYRDVQLTEENIGTYTVQKMVLNIGRQRVFLEPAGTLLIGAKGRVDVIGPAGSARLVLIDSRARGPMRVQIITTADRAVAPQPVANHQIEWQWKIVTNPPKIEFFDLTKEEFFELIMDVGNG